MQFFVRVKVVEQVVEMVQALVQVMEAVLALVEAGIDKKEAIKQVALERKVPKREVYQAVLTWEQKK